MIRQKKSETLLYAVLWTLFLLVPLVSQLLETAVSGRAYDWRSTLAVLLTVCLFAVTFWVHSLFVSPILVYCKRPLRYLAALALTLALFVAALSLFNSQTRPRRQGPNAEERWSRAERIARDKGVSVRDLRPRSAQQAPPDDDVKRVLGGREALLCCIMLLLLVANNGSKHYFKTRDDDERIHQLEKENLSGQLMYLKYQINPHFFMNTLNNIHALVTIDPPQAEHTIEVLSKLMRYMLYDGERPYTTLRKEVDFLHHYIELMRIRYSQRIRITLNVSDALPNHMLPPLLFVSFVENAFKHGVSYEQDSFIEVGLHACGDRLQFTCRNSLRPASSPKQAPGGVGLANVRRRLALLFPDNHTLDITTTDDTYSVVLDIPLTPNTQSS